MLSQDPEPGMRALLDVSLGQLATLFINARAGTSTPEDFRSSLMDTVPATGESAFHNFVQNAVDYYDAQRLEAFAPGSYDPVYPRQPDQGRWQALVGWATNGLFGLEEGPTDEDYETSYIKMEGGFTKTLLNAHRDTVLLTSEADPGSDGWKRVGSGGTCTFCAPRLGQEITSSVVFDSHDHCRCRAVPSFREPDLGGEDAPRGAIYDELVSVDRGHSRLYLYQNDHIDLQNYLRGFLTRRQADNIRTDAGGESLTVHQLAEALDDDFSHAARLQNPTLLYRGEGPWHGNEVHPGSYLTNPGYLSTSASKDMASSFSPNRLYTIVAPKGTPYLKGGDALYAHEREVLLPRNSRMKVLTVTRDRNGTEHVLAEIEDWHGKGVELSPSEAVGLTVAAGQARTYVTKQREAAQQEEEEERLRIPVTFKDIRTPGEESKVAMSKALDPVVVSVNKKLEFTGLTVKAKPYNKGAFVLEIEDAKGRYVGKAARMINGDPNNSSGRSVYHMLFELDREYQKQGVATIINGDLERLYRELGIEQIELNANIDVGGYAWARRGFTWNPREDVFGQAGEIARRIREVAEEFEDPDAIHQIHELEQRLESARSRGDIHAAPTPWEFSNVGWSPGVSSWPGRAGMMGSTWDGVKDL